MLVADAIHMQKLFLRTDPYAGLWFDGGKQSRKFSSIFKQKEKFFQFGSCKKEFRSIYEYKIICDLWNVRRGRNVVTNLTNVVLSINRKIKKDARKVLRSVRST